MNAAGQKMLVGIALLCVAMWCHVVYGIGSQKIFSADAMAVDHFGDAVAMWKDTIVVGAPLNDEFGSQAGAAYVYRWDGLNWIEEAKLTASDAESGDGFGQSVSIHVDTIFVGTPTADAIGPGGADRGSVYVFTRSGSIWTEQQLLTASDASNDDRFGTSVALLGNRAVVGAPFENSHGDFSGSAYVFEHGGGTWAEVQKISASDGASSDVFGSVVALSPDTICVGAHSLDDTAGVDQGGVYLFTHDGIDWTEHQQLFAPDAGESDQFGFSISLFNSTLVVGAPTEDESGENAGSVYVFTRSSGTWSFSQKLLGTDTEAGDHFGVDVALQSTYMVVGAVFEDEVADAAGAAYFFTRTGSVWSEDSKLTDFEGAISDQFGESVAIFQDNVVVGALSDDGPSAQDQGSARVIADLIPDCPADLNADTNVDGADLGLLLGNWGSPGAADLNGDGSTDGADLGLLLGAWGACP